MVEQSRSPKLAILALLAIALFWGYNWTQMKVAVQYAPPFTFAAVRTLFGAVCLFLVMIALRKPLIPQEIPKTFWLGVFQTGGVYGFASWALVSGGAGKTSVLVYTMPFWTLLLAWIFLKEQVRGVQWIAIALSVSGLVMILDPLQLDSSILSKGLAVLAGLCWACGSITAKKLHAEIKVDVLSLTAWQSLFGALPLAMIALLIPAEPILWTPEFVGALIYNVVPGTAIAQLLWLFVLSRLSAGMSGLGMLLTPVVGVLAASIQLGERPGTIELVGMALILVGLITLSVPNLRKAV